MNYSEEQLRIIEKLAGLYMAVSDIAVILGIDAMELRADVADTANEAHLRYQRGKTATKLRLRQQEIQLANVGSPVALDNCAKALLDMEDDE